MITEIVEGGQAGALSLLPGDIYVCDNGRAITNKD